MRTTYSSQKWLNQMRSTPLSELFSLLINLNDPTLSKRDINEWLIVLTHRPDIYSTDDGLNVIQWCNNRLK